MLLFEVFYLVGVVWLKLLDSSMLGEVVLFVIVGVVLSVLSSSVVVVVVVVMRVVV